MGYPIRNNRPDSGRSFPRRDFGSRPTRRPEMHKAICSSCKKECDLPFKPTGDRPVYCRECFAKNGGDKRESFGPNTRDTRDFPRPPFKRFDNAPMMPHPIAPPPPVHSTQLAEISMKLDQLIKLLTPVAATLTPEKKKSEVVEAKVAVAPKEKKEVVVAKKVKTAKKAPKTSTK